MDVYSADWVLPVSEPPIADGAVAVEDRRIAAVGTRAELGAGRRFEGAAIIPGFVNAHSHLEYAVYAGFGDGTPDFADWISTHVRRKQRLHFDHVVDIARLGAAECLASGITTVGDCSFSGATGLACRDLGLRAIVYLEVFGSDPAAAMARFEGLMETAAAGFGELVSPGVSPHAPYTVTVEVYAACAELGIPVATHISESASEVAYLMGGAGPWDPFRELRSSRRARPERACSPKRPARSKPSRPLRHRRAGRSTCCGARGGGAPPALQRPPRLRPRARSRPPRPRCHGRPDWTPRLTPSFDLFGRVRRSTARAGRPDALTATGRLTRSAPRSLGMDALWPRSRRDACDS
jgi:hypothetical protein